MRNNSRNLLKHKGFNQSESLAQNSSFSESTDQQGSSGRLSRKTDKEIQLLIPRITLSSTAANHSNWRREKFQVGTLFFWILRIIYQKFLFCDKSEYIINQKLMTLKRCGSLSKSLGPDSSNIFIAVMYLAFYQRLTTKVISSVLFVFQTLHQLSSFFLVFWGKL